jgi:hypothetical protein
MMNWQGILIGLATGILATLIADNPDVRFHLEKFFRTLFGKPLISATLSGFTNYCSDGMFLIYCIELKNRMWLTSQIPRVYLLSRGTFDYDSRAYKPFIYFRSHGLFGIMRQHTMEQLLEEYSSKIIPYTPDNPELGLTISRRMPYRVVVLCELVKEDNTTKESQSLNSMKVVGDLRLPVANPMPKTTPGAWWDMNVISEDFGLIDTFHIAIPKDLMEQKPLGNSVDVYKMKERPPCLLDLGYETMLTWRLRFTVDDCEIVVRSSIPKEIEIKKPRKKIHGIDLRGILIGGVLKRRRIDINRGIEIQ